MYFPLFNRRSSLARRAICFSSAAAASFFAALSVQAQAVVAPAHAAPVVAPANAPALPPAPTVPAASPAAPVDNPLHGSHNLLVRLAPQPMGLNNAVRFWALGDDAGETLRIRLYEAQPLDTAKTAALSDPEWVSAPVPINWHGWHKVILPRAQFLMLNPGAGINIDLPATDQAVATANPPTPHWSDIDAIGLETGTPNRANLDIDQIDWITQDASGSSTSETSVASFATGDVAAWQSLGTRAQRQSLVYGVTTDPAQVHNGRVAFHLTMTSPAAARTALLVSAQHIMALNHHPYVVWTPQNRFSAILPASLPPADGSDTALSIEAAPNQVYGAGFCLYSAKALTDLTVSIPEDLQTLGHSLPQSIIDVRIVKPINEPGGGLIRNDDFSAMAPELLVKDDRVNLAGTSSVIPLTGDPATDIPANTAKEFWVTFSVPRGAAAGVYHGRLLVSGAGLATSITVGISLDVLPIYLEDPAKQYALGLRSRLDPAPSPLPSAGGHQLVTDFVTPDTLAGQLADISAHGFQIAVLEDSSATLESALSQYQTAGMLSPFIYMGSGDPKTIDSQGRAAHAPELMYFVDPNSPDYAATIKKLSKHGFSIMTFVTHLSDFTPLQSEITIPVYDESGNYSQSLLQSHGKRQFNNQDWWRWPAAQESPLTDRLKAGWSLWRSDLYGAYVPDYQTSFGTDAYDLDSGGAASPNASLRSQMLTYPVQGGVLDTLRWEAIREGVVDVRYLTTLFNNYRQCKDAHIEKGIRTQAMAYVTSFLNKSPEVLTDAQLDAARTEMAHFTILMSRGLSAYNIKRHIVP